MPRRPILIPCDTQQSFETRNRQHFADTIRLGEGTPSGDQDASICCRVAKILIIVRTDRVRCPPEVFRISRSERIEIHNVHSAKSPVLRECNAPANSSVVHMFIGSRGVQHDEGGLRPVIPDPGESITVYAVIRELRMTTDLEHALILPRTVRFHRLQGKPTNDTSLTQTASGRMIWLNPASQKTRETNVLHVKPELHSITLPSSRVASRSDATNTIGCNPRARGFQQEPSRSCPGLSRSSASPSPRPPSRVADECATRAAGLMLRAPGKWPEPRSGLGRLLRPHTRGIAAEPRRLPTNTHHRSRTSQAARLACGIRNTGTGTPVREA